MPLTRTSSPKELLRVVSIGGGTGLSALLRGLKHYAAHNSPRSGAPADFPEGIQAEITAVVTVTDDGGSSGRLRRELHVPPPGDIRNCLVALSEDEDLLSQLFQYRFDAGEGLKGHTLGNLFLTALSQVTGDFPQAVKVCSEVLAIAGHIYPSTDSNVTLRAELQDGTIVDGETVISASQCPIERVRLNPEACHPLPEVLTAIEQADLITLGPGSLFTSVIPNLLVHGIAESIAASKARKVYIANLMWQPGETMHFSASRHVQAILQHAGAAVVDTILLNETALPQDVLMRYRSQQVEPVEQDLAVLEEMGLHVVVSPLLGDTEKIRHDPHRLARALVNLVRQREALRAERFLAG